MEDNPSSFKKGKKYVKTTKETPGITSNIIQNCEARSQSAYLGQRDLIKIDMCFLWRIYSNPLEAHVLRGGGV